MNKYYIGTGKQLLFPEQCDGPFNTPEEAKEHLRSFDQSYASPEMLGMTIVVVNQNKRISLYREGGEVVTLGSVV